jgi:Holliday junction resolvase-like predicted endonuclease
MTTTYDEVLELFRQVAESQRETERLLKEQSLEADRRFREGDRKLNKLEALFTSQWGKLMESLVEGDLVEMLNQRGIEVASTTSRLKGKLANGHNYEFDIIAHNGEAIVVVEVKTTLRPQDVHHFLERLGQFKDWVPHYAEKRVHGAVAWLTADAGAEDMAINRGLFSIRATGHSASIQNEATFTPRVW